MPVGGFYQSSYAPTAGLPFSVTSRKRVEGGQLTSFGTLEKTTPQSQIALTIRNGIPACGRERGKVGTDVYAQYSDSPKVNEILRSDILLTLAEGTRSYNNDYNNGFPNIDCFTAVNGISTDQRLIFAGVATNPGMSKGWDEKKDGAAACAVAGSDTIVNTGPKTIYAGDKVWYSEYGYTVQVGDGDMKEEVTGVYEIGRDQKQIKAALHSMSFTNIITIMRQIEKEVEAIYIKNHNDGKEMNKLLENSLQLMCLEVHMPLYIYAFLYLGFVMYADIINHHETWRIEFIKDMLCMWFKYCAKSKKMYDTELDVGLEMTNEIDHSDGDFIPKMKDTDLNNIDLFGTWHRVIAMQFLKGISSVQALQQDWINARYVGTALTTAEPAFPFDISIRAGNG